MAPRLFDRDLLVTRRRRALAEATPGAGFLLERAADELLDRLAATTRDFAIALDVATPTAALAERLAASGRVTTVIRLDHLPPEASTKVLAVVGDEELLPIAPGGLDLAVSALALQFVNDLPGTLVQIRRALKPDGLFLASFLGGETLAELRVVLAEAETELRGGASLRVAPFTDLRDLGGLLQRAGFALPVADLDRVTVRYPDALALMRDLRAMGATNALVERERRPLRRDVLLRAAAIYGERFADADGKIRATFDLLSLSGWAPHESQQQPLKPGSARQRLADALGVREQPAGEKAG